MGIGILLFLCGGVWVALQWNTDDAPSPVDTPSRPTKQSIHTTYNSASERAPVETEQRVSVVEDVSPYEEDRATNCQVTILFVDQADQPLRRFRFEWAALRIKDAVLLRVDAARSMPSAFSAGEADEHGQWIGSVPHVSYLCIRSDGQFRHLGGVADDIGGRFAPHEYDVIIVPGNQEVSIAARSEWSKSLVVAARVIYADGTPFEGTLRWLVRRFDEVLQRGTLDPCPPIVEVNAAIGTEVRLIAVSHRARYKAMTVEAIPVATDIELKSPIIVIIQADERRAPPTFLEIDCKLLPPDASAAVRVFQQESAMIEEFSVTGPTTLKTHDLSTAGNCYWIIVTGDYAWTSGPITVIHGQVNKVQVQPALCGAIRARAVDANRETIHPAAMLLTPATRCDWSMLPSHFEGERNGVITGSKRDGALRLGHVSPGTHVITFDAPGYEIRTLEVVVTSGNEIDVGTIVLERATASVMVRIVGIAPSSKEVFRVSLFALPEGAMYPPKKSDAEGQAKCMEVPAGAYQILVNELKGGIGWLKKFHLERGQELEVEIDVSKPRGALQD